MQRSSPRRKRDPSPQGQTRLSHRHSCSAVSNSKGQRTNAMGPFTVRVLVHTLNQLSGNVQLLAQHPPQAAAARFKQRSSKMAPAAP